ncbi:hypothetical protein HPB51_018401 [Rhipicephalus microplus]|uniref:Uncharacterized protein n=1 Tax=Rhipicephalus microplus TaxID=6941 RepID=A0A9J6EU26_RHIMP|nr:hypothetical protein HPB51_018401 [Rhipicephalus microplus]
MSRQGILRSNEAENGEKGDIDLLCDCASLENSQKLVVVDSGAPDIAAAATVSPFSMSEERKSLDILSVGAPNQSPSSRAITLSNFCSQSQQRSGSPPAMATYLNPETKVDSQVPEASISSINIPPHFELSASIVKRGDKTPVTVSVVADNLISIFEASHKAISPRAQECSHSITTPREVAAFPATPSSTSPDIRSQHVPASAKHANLNESVELPKATIPDKMTLSDTPDVASHARQLAMATEPSFGSESTVPRHTNLPEWSTRSSEGRLQTRFVKQAPLSSPPIHSQPKHPTVPRFLVTRSSQAMTFSLARMSRRWSRPYLKM